MKNEDIMFSLVKEIREDQKDLKNEFHEHALTFREHMAADEKMYVELKHINNVMYENTESLKEHMRQTLLVREQTDILRNMYENQRKRIDYITKPLTVKSAIGKFAKICGWVSAIAGAVYGISKFLQ